jgi:hypothetical protein
MKVTEIKKRSSCNFGWNYEPNHNILYPRLKRQYILNVKLNDYWKDLYKNKVQRLD